MSQAQVWLAVWSAALLLLGLFLGALWGWGRGAAEEREDARWEREQRPRLRAGIVMPPWPRGTAVDWLAGVRPTGTVTTPPEVAHEWEPVHVGQALALTADTSVTAWTQQMAERMDAWLAANVYAVPYSADELWSGQ